MKSITPHAAMLAGCHGVGPRFRAMQATPSDEEFDVVLATQGETREQQRLASSHDSPTSVAVPSWCPPSRCFPSLAAAALGHDVGHEQVQQYACTHLDGTGWHDEWVHGV